MPLHLQVSSHFRQNIVSGALKPGDRLPSARTLARDLRVSRNTVDAAFGQLRSEGLIVRRVGAGTVVAPDATSAAPFAQVARSRHPEARPAQQSGSDEAIIPEP